MSPFVDGEMFGSMGDGVLSEVHSMSELLQEFPLIRGMLHGVVIWNRGVCLWAAPTVAVPSRPGARRP